MSWGMNKDFGAYMKPVRAGAEVDVTAGGSGDATEVNGAWIDTKGFESLEAILSYTATLAATETMTLAANIQDADTIAGANAADVSTQYLSALSATTVATGDSGGSTETGIYSVGVDLTMLRRFVRIQWTPNLSASGTDTAKIGSLYVLGGAKYPPANANRTVLRA